MQPPGHCKWVTFNPWCTRACLKLSYKYYNKLIRVDIFKPINFDVIIMLVFITQQTEQWILNSFCFIYIKCQYVKIDSLSSRKTLPVVSFCMGNYLGMSFVPFGLEMHQTQQWLWQQRGDQGNPARCEECHDLLPSPPPEGKTQLLRSLALSSSANAATSSFWVGWPGS